MPFARIKLIVERVKKFCHEVALWRRLDHQNIAKVLGVMMDPYQIVFDRVSDKDIVKYTATEEGVDRLVLVSLSTASTPLCPSESGETCL